MDCEKNHEVLLHNFTLECANAVRWEYCCKTNTIWFSDEFYQMTGLDGQRWRSIVNPYLNEIKEQVVEILDGSRILLSLIVNIQGADGKEHWFNIRGKFFDDDKAILFGVLININEQKKIEKRLWELAYRDEMTNLYQLNYIKDLIAGRIDGVKLIYPAFMTLDICDFSAVNEAFGHDRGNQVLAKVSKRLLKLFKDEIIVRVSGDEFLIIFNQVRKDSQIMKAAKAILFDFKKPVSEGEHDFYLSFKIGITVPGEKEIDNARFSVHLQDAEIALQRAKDDERNDICIINNDIRKNFDEMNSLAYKLRKAVEGNDFVVYFQPIISTKTKKLIGCEALVRWVQPDGSLISPLRFIPVAEELGLIIDIGEFVMEESMRELSKWLKYDPDFYVSINVSYLQFISEGFVKRLKELVNFYQVPYSAIDIELTESIFITDMEHMTKCLKELRDLGIKVSLDDFGTGYSSLSYLKRIPLDNLKIDREFLLDVAENASSAAILRTIISLARDLNLSITAEGVETIEQLSLLEEYGCDLLQGFYFSKPVLPGQIDSFLAEKGEKVLIA
ncbi:MAG: bifunctional diguanylate cyclase/phosphodiesterase [Lachnospiraceae bacterium]|nr:bifunctional diguanylate cyclase/phosphodiesterase [Lachnospiraceae bacterium]